MIFKKTCRGWGGGVGRQIPQAIYSWQGPGLKKETKKKKTQQRQREIKLGGFDRLVKHIGTSAID